MACEVRPHSLVLWDDAISLHQMLVDENLDLGEQTLGDFQTLGSTGIHVLHKARLPLIAGRHS